jgi:hypothetical protein
MRSTLVKCGCHFRVWEWVRSNKAQTMLNSLNSLAISNQEKIGRNVSLKGLPTKEGLHVHEVTELGRRHPHSVSHTSADRRG